MSADRLWNLIRLMQEDHADGHLASVEEYVGRLPEAAEEVRAEHGRLVSESTSPPGSGTLPAGLPPIGPYRVLRLLGRGAQGSVFLAEDTRHPRKVALKVLPPWTGRSMASGIRRLQREGEALAKLAHPSVCRFLDSGEVDGAPYLVTEFIDGVTLRALLADIHADGVIEAEAAGEPRTGATSLPLPPRSPRDWKQLLAFFRDCADALHSAHLAGIVHRDVKPGNLMVTRRGAPMVLDFGLAQDDARASSRITHTGSALGTPAYMAPELLHGATPDARSDLYSLAATLYECATGRLPHQGDSFPQVVRSIEARDPTPVCRVNPALPKELEVVLAVAMSKDPQRRYADLRAFAEDLDAIRERRPIQARRLGFGLRVKRWMQRHPVWTTLGFSACVLLGMRSLQTRDLLEEKQRGLIQAERDKYLLAARLLEEQQPAGAIYLARAAMEVKRDSVARAALLSALHRLRVYPTASGLTGAECPREVRDPVSGLILACNLDGELQLAPTSPSADGLRTFPLPEGDWFGRRDDEMGGRLALSMGGATAAFAPVQGAPWILDVASGAMRALDLDASLEVVAMTFLEGNRRLAIADRNGFLHVHDLASDTAIASVHAHEGFLGAVVAWHGADLIVTGSPGGHRAGSASDRHVRYWRLDPQAPGGLDRVAEFELEGFLSAWAVEEEQGRIHLGDSEGHLLTFDASDLTDPRQRTRLPNRVHGIAVNRAGDRILAGFGFNPDRASQVATGAWLIPLADAPGTAPEPIALRTGSATCSGVVFLPEGGLFAVQDWAGTIHLFDETGTPLWSHRHGRFVSRSLAWSEEQGCFVLAPRLGTPRLIYPPSPLFDGFRTKPAVPQLAAPAASPEDPERVIASWTDAEGRHLLLASGACRTVRTDGSKHTQPGIGGQLLRWAEPSPDGTEILALDREHRLVHATRGADAWRSESFPLPHATNASRILAVPSWSTRKVFLRDGSGAFHVFDLQTRRLLPVAMPPLLTRPLSLTLDRAGRRIAIGSEDGLVHLVDLERRDVQTLDVTRAPEGAAQQPWLRMPRALAFEEDGERLVASLGPSILQDWDLTADPPSLIQERHPMEDVSESDHIALLPDGDRLLANRSRRSLFLLDADGNVLDSYVLSARATIDGLFEWDDGHVVIPTREGPLFVFRIVGRGIEAVSIVPLHASRVIDVDRSDDGDFLLSRSEDGAVSWWPLYPEDALRDLAMMRGEFSLNVIPGLLGSAGVRMGIPPHEWIPVERQ